jgi:hypothetical protein
MSATITTYGYLDLPYLNDPYGAGLSTYAFPFQVARQIDATRDIKTQVQRIAAAIHNINTQIQRQIDGEHPVKIQIEARIDALKAVKFEVDRLLLTIHNINVQVNRNVSTIHAVDSQISTIINGSKTNDIQINRTAAALHEASTQINRLLSTTKTKLSEINRGRLLHATCDDSGYLTDAYLSFAYLVRTFCVTMGVQVNRITTQLHPVDEQIQRQITRGHTVNTQIQRQIDAQHAALMQVDRVQATTKGMQILFALYNTYNLRILCDFPSRGTTGLNWTANSTAAGDFSVNNLNTDIVEQIWRSVSGVKTGLVLTCDTEIPQGVFLDTLGMLNHNLTRSATVQLQGSTDAGFATIGFDENLEVLDDVNLYYIAPTLPQVSFRYWRFIINDSTNTNSSLQIGTIVFGSSVIFQGECFVDQVQRGTKHFSDKVETEGFTNVSNDRALKYSTQLEFRFLNFQRGNFRNIRNIFKTARTSLKCLWIPTPQFPDRFAVFGKLTQIPVETHKVISEDADYVSFNLEVDESL